MTTYVVLLRGVNVGGRRQLPMAALRAACSDAGFADVRSYIQSGNLVLAGTGDTGTVEVRIEAAIRAGFGFAVDAIARTAGQWAGHVAGNPMPEAAAAEPGRMMLVLSRPPLDVAAIAALRDRAVGGEEIAAVGDALYVHFPNGAGRSRLAAALGRGPSTARNWRTVLKIAELAGS